MSGSCWWIWANHWCFLQGPDHVLVVLWSPSLKKAYIIELTVPWEDSVDVVFEQKHQCYADLGTEAHHCWNMEIHPAEVECRDFVANLPPSCGEAWESGARASTSRSRLQKQQREALDEGERPPAGPPVRSLEVCSGIGHWTDHPTAGCLW